MTLTLVQVPRINPRGQHERAVPAEHIESGDVHLSIEMEIGHPGSGLHVEERDLCTVARAREVGFNRRRRLRRINSDSDPILLRVPGSLGKK